MGDFAAPALVHGLSTQEVELLKLEVERAKRQAYCPYSRFPVGCTILLKTDSAAVVKVASDAAESMPSSSLAAYTVSGANIENAAYPSGICAERNALASAVFKGMRKGDARAIFVTTNMKAMCSPCGMCRQVIREFCEQDTPIFMLNVDGEYTVKTLEELLPMSFGPESLENAAVE